MVFTGELVRVLVAQEEDLVLQQCRVDFVEQAVIVHCIAETHVEQFRADGTGQRFDSHFISFQFKTRWLRSPGPRTAEGKARLACNGYRVDSEEISADCAML